MYNELNRIQQISTTIDKKIDLKDKNVPGFGRKHSYSRGCNIPFKQNYPIIELIDSCALSKKAVEEACETSFESLNDKSDELLLGSSNLNLASIASSDTSIDLRNLCVDKARTYDKDQLYSGKHLVLLFLSKYKIMKILIFLSLS